MNAFKKSLVALSLLAAPSFAASVAELPQLFAQNPALFDVKISPDGKHLSARTFHEGDTVLLVLDAATMKPVQLVRLGGADDVGDYRWVNNERLVMKVTESHPWDKEPQYRGELFGINIDGSKNTLLFGYRAGEQQLGSKLKVREGRLAWASFVDMRADKDDRVLILSTPESKAGERFPELLAMDVYNGKTYSRGTIPARYAHVLAGADGRARVAIGTASNTDRDVFIRDEANEGGEWKKLASAKFGSQFVPLALSQDNKSVFVFDNFQSDKSGVFQFEIATQKMKELIVDKNVDITYPIMSVDKRQIYAVRVDDGKPAYLLLNGEHPEAKIFKELLGAFPGEDVQITSMTDDASKLVVHVSSDVNAGAFYLFNNQTGDLAKLSSTYPHLAKTALAAMEPIQFKARDGMTIHGYLTKAPQASKEAPLVVLVHGGPKARDYWGYNPEVQMLALSGYNVLQVNYRGSRGYGVGYELAGDRHWADLIQYDIIDGTKWAFAQGHGKAGNACIVGASFGGYSAVMASTIEPDLYKCAIATAGVYDMNLMYSRGDIKQVAWGEAYLDQVIGKDPAVLQQTSPTSHVAKLKASLLIMHGKRDDRAPIEHAEALKDALEKVNKPYDWYEFNDEAHGFYDAENQAQYMSHMQQFLQKNLKI